MSEDKITDKQGNEYHFVLKYNKRADRPCLGLWDMDVIEIDLHDKTGTKVYAKTGHYMLDKEYGND